MVLQIGKLKIEVIDIHSILSALALVICYFIKDIKPLLEIEYLKLILNLEGTLFIAGSISSANKLSGLGNTLLEKLDWAFIKPLSGNSTIKFNPLRFYFGLSFIFLGSIL